jgi:hypothetical protein
MPARNASNASILNIDRVDIYRLAEPLSTSLSLTEEEFASRSTLIATVAIKDSDFGLKEKSYTDTLKFSRQAARLRYAIRFANKSGQKAAFSNYLIIEPTSRIARNPDQLLFTLSQDQIALRWTAPTGNVDGSTPANIIGYNIYRNSADNQTRRLNSEPVPDSNFADKFFKFGEVYTYYVRTVSLGSNGEQVESLGSEKIEIKPLDSFAPTPPAAITIAAAPNNISIFFAFNTETDIRGYQIFRSTELNTPKEKWKPLNEDLIQTNTFQDKQVEPGKIYYYYIIAIDQFGNKSDPSEIVSERAL